MPQCFVVNVVALDPSHIYIHPACSGMASGGGDRLRVVTAVNLRQKMDALVSDLSHALDESQLPQYHRKRRGFKRRAKLATNLGKGMPPCLD